jgi:zinc transport system substrate-binding protein
MKKIIIFISIVVIALIAIIVGGIFVVKNSTGKPKVVTTLFPFYDIVKNIGKDKVDVSLLLPPGVEAHTFEPKPSDILAINESAIFIYTGDILEPWVSDIISGITDNSVDIINASKGIRLLKEGGSAGQEMDPHFWLDFRNMIKVAQTISAELISKDPWNTDFYKLNTEAYIKSLNTLDSDYKRAFNSCKTKDIVYAGHYAFGYLAKRYNLYFESALGTSPNSEPSAQDIAKLVDLVRKENIRYVYYEELVSPNIAETLSNESGAQSLILNPAHNLTKEQFDNNATFDSIMRYNLENLKTGLQCR